MMLDRVGSVRKSECMMGFCVTWKVTMNNVQDVGCEDVRQRGERVEEILGISATTIIRSTNSELRAN